jgi:hypothetical protein
MLKLCAGKHPPSNRLLLASRLHVHVYYRARRGYARAGPYRGTPPAASFLQHWLAYVVLLARVRAMRVEWDRPTLQPLHVYVLEYVLEYSSIAVLDYRSNGGCVPCVISNLNVAECQVVNLINFNY